MLGTKPRPMIGKLSELLISSRKPRFLDVGSSPRSPLDHFKSPSPRRLRRFDVGGVGLGIVAALEKSSLNSDCCRNYPICSSNLNRPNGIGVDSGKDYDSLEMESSEEFTYVTSRHGNGKSSMKVYYDGGYDEQRRFSSGHDRIGFDGFKETPTARFDENVSYPTSDFLSCCHLCRKKLHGKDIYMYRGEKGFCSSECRSRQIMMDERKEQRRSSRSAKVSISPCNNNNSGQIFSTGILAI